MGWTCFAKKLVCGSEFEIRFQTPQPRLTGHQVLRIEEYSVIAQGSNVLVQEAALAVPKKI